VGWSLHTAAAAAAAAIIAAATVITVAFNPMMRILFT
jgi:hypothetical protein